MPISGIYIIINPVSATAYIGQACDVRRRWNTHKSMLNRKKHQNPHLQAAWNKYGSENFLFELLETCEGKEDLLEAEQFWVDYLSFIGGKLYNISSPTFSMLGFHHSEEVKRKLSVFHTGNTWAKGNKLSLETRTKMSEKAFSEDTRRNMAEGQRGRIHSAETKQKIKLATLGRKVSEETKKKRAETLKNRSRVSNEETNLKRSISLKNYWNKKRGAE